MAGHIIYSCTVLHNFLIANNYPVDDLEPEFEDEVSDFDEDLDDFEITYDELQRGVCSIVGY